MFCFGSLDVRIKLRRLPSIKSSVVAHDTNFAMPKALDTVNFLGRPRVADFRILPSHQQRQLSRVVNTGKHIVFRNTRVC